jgi:ERCC4-type nuclease
MNNALLNSILDSITILIDTREHSEGNCAAIMRYFDSKGIKHIRKALKFGDYSFYIPAFPEIGLDTSSSFENELVFERKASITELSGNLSQNRERFENEFIRAKEVGAKVILLVENGSFMDILQHKYRTGLNEKSYIASLFSFQHRFNIDIQFIPAKMTGWYIANCCRYYLREKLKELEVA